MIDENFGIDENFLFIVVKLVEDFGVLVFFVGVGSVVDRNELSVILFNFLDVIFLVLGENLLVVVDCIMERILRCKI